MRRPLISPVTRFPVFRVYKALFCRYGSRLICVAWLSSIIATQSHGADIHQIDIKYKNKTYHISYQATLYADTYEVERIFTNYTNLKTLSARVIESTVLSQSTDNVRLRLVLKPCILFYCKQLTKTSDVHVTRNGVWSVKYIADPEVSDFSIADEHLVVEKDNGQTKLSYNATLTPKFRVPPLVGPWIIKHVLRDELLEVGENVEKLTSGRSL